MTPKKTAPKKTAPKKTAPKTAPNGTAKVVLSPDRLARFQKMLPRGTKLYWILKKRTDTARFLDVLYIAKYDGKPEINAVAEGLWEGINMWDKSHGCGRVRGTGTSPIQHVAEALGRLIWGDDRAFTFEQSDLT